MRVWIDADGCPVMDLAVRLAREAGLLVTLVCDAAHEMTRYPDTEILTVPTGADSADWALLGRVAAGDVVVTQDYGLAALCLAKGARPIRQDGVRYTEHNIDALLEQRHWAGRIRRSGGRLKGPKRRTQDQDEHFSAAFRRLLE
jgi:uncharacterized protein YaiI (UPF0178 family)